VRHAAGEFHDLDAPLDIAFRVGDGLAVFGREEGGERIHLLCDQVQKLEHHPRASLGVGRCPGRLRRLCVRYCSLDFLPARKRNLGLYVAGIRVVDVAKPSGGTRDGLAADEMANLAHTGSPY